VIEGLVDMDRRHATREALKNLGSRQARPTNGQLATQELRIRIDVFQSVIPQTELVITEQWIRL
jgi:hypothetical protein